MKRHRVTGSNGVGLAVFEQGMAGNQPIILIHGWSQHHLSWLRQLEGSLADHFHLIAPDLRGHGASDKPLDEKAYNHSRPWAEDIAAIMEELGLNRPILVGWSMGGWIVCDYLRVFGDDKLAGIVLVGSGIRMDPQVAAKRSEAVKATNSYGDDQQLEIDSIIDFVRACSHQEIEGRDFTAMVAMNMLCPPPIRKACRSRVEDYRDVLAQVKVPTMIIQGAEEQVCIKPMFDEVVAALPQASVNIYDGCGHMPFWENHTRFNADLRSFAQTVRGN